MINLPPNLILQYSFIFSVMTTTYYKYASNSKNSIVYSKSNKITTQCQTHWNNFRRKLRHIQDSVQTPIQLLDTKGTNHYQTASDWILQTYSWSPYEQSTCPYCNNPLTVHHFLVEFSWYAHERRAHTIEMSLREFVQNTSDFGNLMNYLKAPTLSQTN